MSLCLMPIGKTSLEKKFKIEWICLLVFFLKHVGMRINLIHKALEKKKASGQK